VAQREGAVGVAQDALDSLPRIGWSSFEIVRRRVADAQCGLSGRGVDFEEEIVGSWGGTVLGAEDESAVLAAQVEVGVAPGVELRGAARPNAESADLMSYLLFDSSFTRALIDIGYRDAGRRIDEIEEFLCQPVVKRPAARREAAKRSAAYPKLVERPG